jgi:nitrogen fixation NifU-like protein
MEQKNPSEPTDLNTLRTMLSESGYAGRAIDYYLERPNEGHLEDASTVTELTGTCGDTMKCYLKVRDDRIEDVKYQVLGCPGAVSAAMALADLARGKTPEEALEIKDQQVFRELIEIPDQKQHCIRLAVKTLQKAIREYRETT